MDSINRLSSTAELDANEDAGRHIGQISFFPWNKSDTLLLGVVEGTSQIR